MGFIQTFKSAFFMAHRHLLTSISCTLLLVSCVLLTLMFHPFIFAAPGTYALLTSYLFMRVFKKYRPEIDKDPRLEIAEIEAAKADERRKKDFWDDSEDEEE